MRALATVRKIGKITPIDGADRIKLAHVDGWQCVIAANDFMEGDTAVFFEIDSALDSNDERFSFLKDRCLKEWKTSAGVLIDSCIRIKTCRFKGVLSQGLCMPLKLFPEISGHHIGDDVTAHLNVRLFDEVNENAEIKTGKAKVQGEAKGNFPYFIPKTDEPRLQNLMDYFETMKALLFECTEKYDGSSTTFFYAGETRHDSPFGVCSRNIELKPSEDNIFWKMARKYDIERKLRDFCTAGNREIAIQGETVGVGINGNRDLYSDNDFYVFRIYDIKKKEWLSPKARHLFCEQYGLKHVKTIRKDWFVFEELKTIDDFLSFVQGKTDRGNEREGMVWKSYWGTVSFKVINPVYLLKEK